jgi:TPR repeat protein
LAKNQQQAIKYYQLAANQGYGEAQYKLGTYYEEGEELKKDLVKAAELYQLAADRGHITAQYQLGKCYNLGKGVKKDLLKAIELFQLVKDKHPLGKYALSRILEEAM